MIDNIAPMITLLPVEKLLPRKAPTVRLTVRGLIINREAARVLDLHSGDRVQVLYNVCDKTDIYISKSQGNEGYNIKRRNHAYYLNSRSLSRALRNYLNVERALYRLGEPECINYMHVTSIITRINYASTTKKADPV